MLEKPKINKILYCTDLGKHTIPVFMHALALAEQNNATLTILHVVEPMSDTAKAVIQTYLADTDVKKIEKDGMHKVFGYIKKRVDDFLQENCGGDLETAPIDGISIASGRPSEEILRMAEVEKIDLIVLGKSSSKVLGSRVMGSTARRVSRLSQVPVLVVPNR